jgi:hypothetical protein
MDALPRAAISTCCCAGPLGAVRELARPFWFTAEPRITAHGSAAPELCPSDPTGVITNARQASPPAVRIWILSTKI